MARRPGPSVSVYDIKKRTDRAVPRPFAVRWRVSGRERSKAFSHKAPAEEFRARLLLALREGERFDRDTGLPSSWNTSELTVAQWAHRWFREQWPTWEAGSRRSAADSLKRALPKLLTSRAPDLDEKAAAELRTEIVRWLQRQDADPIPDHLRRYSLPLADVNSSHASDAWRALGFGFGGKAYGANMAARMRSPFKAMLNEAARVKVMDPIDWSGTKTRRRQKVAVTSKYDPAHVVSPPQFGALLSELGPRVTDNRPRKYRDEGAPKGRCTKDYRPYFGLIGWAGLRPGEALAVDASDFTLPDGDDEWGMVVVSRSARGDTQEVWLDGDSIDAAVKAGKVGRQVPIPPELVVLLREPVARGGRLFDGWSRSAISKAWTAAKKAAWPAGDLQEAIPYDLRHFNATLLLRSGLTPAQAAARLGHDPATLLKIYEGLFEGDEASANARISQALRG